jgi:hypothetical protein
MRVGGVITSLVWGVVGGWSIESTMLVLVSWRCVQGDTTCVWSVRSRGVNSH